VPADDAELVAAAKNGDLTAYDRLVSRYQGLAHRVAFVITGDATEAEDAAQDGFVKAYAALGRFRDGATFRPWILQIVANEARNRRRSAGRRRHHELRARGDAPAPSAEAEALSAHDRDELLATVNGLPEKLRLAVACRYFLDLSEAETAAVLGCAPGTVKSRLSRALNRLRRDLTDPRPEDPDAR